MQIPSSLSTRMQYQHQSLIDLIDGLTEEQARRQLIPGKWSVFEHIVHLQTYQHIFIDRVRVLLDGKQPAFPRYAAENDPEFLENCHKSFREIMSDLVTIRKELSAGLLGLREEDYRKIATHPAFGSMNLLQWMNFFLLHEAHHLFSIFKLAAALKQEAVTD